ncbi:hypothetical protein OG242_24815 [Streptomyces sp. NBC_00727]|uniref:hypothetical protein n=1 Tax=Streptomyces sp. NBC_00727 TaxID=2903675 RepID=UPI00386C0631
MRSIRPLLAATGLVAASALTVTACGPTEDEGADKPAATASASASGGTEKSGGIPADLADKLKKHGGSDKYGAR